MLFWFEGFCYRQAAHVVALSDTMAGRIKKKSPSSRISVVPNMSDNHFFKAGFKQVSTYDNDHPFVVGYVGAIGYANGLDHVIECARESAWASLPVRFVICGSGAQLASLKLKASNWSLSNVSFVPFQNRDGVRDLLQGVDASFISFLPFEILETGSPNKYFDALAAGKFIVINFGGWMKEEIEKHQCGVSIDQNVPGDFVKKLQPIVANPSSLRDAQQRAQQLATQHYDKQLLGKKLSDILTRLR